MDSALWRWRADAVRKETIHTCSRARSVLARPRKCRPGAGIRRARGRGSRHFPADTGGANWRPRVTPDGRYIVFCSTRSGRQNVWRIDFDGGNPTRLTSGEGEGTPYVSPDGHWLYYTNYAVTPNAIE